MIYECPNCQMPQHAGQIACPRCHAQFDGPVPDDAIVPVEKAAEAPTSAPEAVAPAAETRVSAGTPEGEAAPAVTVAPPVEETSAASGAQPYLSPPSYSPPSYSPPYVPQDAAPIPMRAPLGSLSRGLLIAFPIVLILVLGSVYYTNSLNAGADTSPPPSVSIPAPPPAPAAAPAPVGSPTVMQGGGNTAASSSDPRAKMLVGRWVAGSGDYYIFSSDGTGSRGNSVKQQDQPFLWGLVQNRLMLYLDKNEMLRFNAGPDSDTIFLASDTGHYLQYTRSKT